MLSHNDEREQTLNQILCELDGFEAKTTTPRPRRSSCC